MSQRLGRWIDNEQAVCPVDQYLLTGLDLCRGVVQTDHCRNIQRTSNDRSMRRAAAEIGGDAEHALLVHRGRVRGGKIMREKDVRLGKRVKCLRFSSLQIADDPLGHVLNIERALAQVGIVYFAQCLDIIFCDFMKHPLDITKIGLQFAQHFINQSAVLDDKQMRIEDGRIFRPNRFRDALLHLENLHARLN